MNRKAVVKGTIKISFIVVLIAALGFLVFNYVIPVLAAHTSTATVTPNIVQGGTTNVLFTAVITNTGGSPISEFRIYNNTIAQNPDGVSPFTGLVCDPAVGWFGPFYIPGVLPFCQYTAKTVDDYIEPSESKTFTFSFDIPIQPSTRTIQLETRDPDQFYTPLPVNISVDGTPPVTTKSFDGPQKNDEGVEWIDGVTKVVLNPTDPQPHPSGVDKTWYLNVIDLSENACWNPVGYCNPTTVPSPYADGTECINSAQEWCTENWEEKEYDSWEACVEDYAHNECQVDPLWKLYTGPFQKAEESCHVLQFFSIDNIGNIEQMNTNCFFVDKTPPVLTKDVGEPKADKSGVKFTTAGTGTAGWSNEQAYSGSYSAKMTTPNPGNEQGRATLPFSGNLNDITSFSYWDYTVNAGTYGQLAIWASIYLDDDDDGLWDYYIQAEPIYTYGNPVLNTWQQYDAYNMKWESAEGPDCPYSAPTLGDYISGAAMSMYCPNSAGPFASREYGSLKIIKIDMRAGYGGPWPGFVGYTDDVVINDNTLLSEPDWSVSPQTDITFTCTDPEPHPSDDEKVCFKVSFDKEPYNLTSLYATKYQTSVGQDGFACVPVNGNNQSVFNFNNNEDSTHDLEYYCKDAVGKKTETEIQWYKVDSAPPVITKETIGPKVGACPPEPADPLNPCYIQDSGTIIRVDVEDNAGAHDSGVDYCSWSYTLDGQQVGEPVYESEFPFSIVFPEDSTHVLTITCWDNLGNEAEDIETFLVDSTPPITKKTYGDPVVGPRLYSLDGEIPVWVDYISVETPITLTASDEKVGVDTTYYIIKVPCEWGQNPRLECDQIEWIGYVDQQIYYDYETCAENNDRECITTWWDVKTELTDGWTPYEGPFNIPQESIHKICFYSVDKLGNEEEKQCQIAIVDDTPPEGIKEVGQPSVPVDNGSPGDNLRQIEGEYSQSCSINTGLAFDGTNLIISCWYHNDLDFLDPADGSLVYTLDVPGYTGLQANAWDATRGKLWQCAEQNKVLLVDTSDGSSVLYTHDGITCTDGLAYDGTDDTLWLSPDVSGTIYHYSINEDNTLTRIGTFSLSGLIGSCGNSGIAVGGDNLYLANDGCSEIYEADKDLTSSSLFSSFPRRLEDLECDDITFADQGVGAIWSQDAYDRTINAWEIPKGLCGFGGLPAACGNGIVEPPEECDDGNNVNGDGCSAACRIEGEVQIDWYVSQETPISLTCRDQEPHPVDNESICYRVSFDDPQRPFLTEQYCDKFGGEFDEENGLCCVANNEYQLNFMEDTTHDLEFFCKDALENTGGVDLEYFAVDTVPPVIEKTIVGPQIECTDYEGKLDCFQIDGVTEIQVDASDPEPHPVNDVTCDWYYEVTDNGASGGEEDVTPPFVIQFPEESTHDLTITCRDALGNEARDEEIFIVDKTAPETTKTYEGPQYPEQGYPKWITSDTNIILDATDDVGLHDSGVKATYWRNTLVDDKYCWDQELCQEEAQGSGNFQLYTDPFNKGEESCHLIEFYSVDNVNKTEDVNKQCVFVDNSPPTPNKTVKEPREEWHPTTDLLDPDRTNFYPEIVDKCWNGHEDEIECWKITTMTPIKLDCNDPEPHPVDQETVFFMVDLDGEDVTADYCDNEGGTYNEETGWCEVSGEVAPVWFKFKEETEHNLKYYCEDALGNAGPIDEEKFKVEGEKFKIDLNKKWNLISVPFRLLDGAMDKVWEDTAEEVMTVWTYDPLHEMCGTDWCVYTPDGVANDNLLTMLPGWGYWVLANKSTQLLVGGSLFSPIIIPSSKEMVNGWNLVGYYGNEDEYGNVIKKYDGPDGDGRPARCALGSLVNTVLGNPKWNALVTYWEPYNPDQWIFLNQGNYMNPGAGYWLELDLDPSEEEFYSYSTTCPFFP